MIHKTKSNLNSLPRAESALIDQIKAKRELQNVPDSFIHQYLAEYLRKKNISLPLSKKSNKIVIKDIRSALRLKTGRFKGAEWHLSVKERIEVYPILRELITQVNPKSILDLGCGLNPLFLAKPGIKYYAYDIQADDINEINNYFRKNNIEGKARVADITTYDFPNADICLLLKVLDIMDTHGKHKQSEILLKRIPSKYIIASFSTKTLSGRPMNHPQRGWIERLCTRLGYRFERRITTNEIFYLIEKH